MYRPGANSISVIRSAISLSAFGPTPEKMLTLPSSVVFCFLVIATASSRNVRARCFLLYPVVPYAGDTADVFCSDEPSSPPLGKDGLDLLPRPLGSLLGGHLVCSRKREDRKSTRLYSSHVAISYAV